MVLLNEENIVPNRPLVASVKKDRDTSYLDNGASNHMTSLKEVFAELDENVSGQVKFGDDSRVPIKGKGTILFELSLDQHTEKGYEVSMRGEYLKLFDEDERLVLKTQRERRVTSFHGGEFNSHQLKEFCSQHGIQRQLTAPYTPQQNGVVDRHQIVVKGNVSALTSMGRSRATCSILTESYSNKAYVKNTSNHVTKLADRSEAMVYLGVEEGSKAYRFLNPKEKKIVVGRDVVFTQKKRWIWQESQTNKDEPVQSWLHTNTQNDDQGFDQSPFQDTSDVEEVPTTPAHSGVPSGNLFSPQLFFEQVSSQGSGKSLTSLVQSLTSKEGGSSYSGIDDTHV
ncbi:hypothetical protein E3N88_23030 [Mikania micrantha]|uniref:Integrase catalytic domain-containing protein n=1 Tax=Mikania micrantha TaxID=192012 RepID=A0A5N6ND78_9ASTR|nr:hypothetical protein E3N88_23030 [Mikania micrantha]